MNWRKLISREGVGRGMIVSSLHHHDPELIDNIRRSESVISTTTGSRSSSPGARKGKGKSKAKWAICCPRVWLLSDPEDRRPRLSAEDDDDEEEEDATTESTPQPEALPMRTLPKRAAFVSFSHSWLGPWLMRDTAVLPESLLKSLSSVLTAMNTRSLQIEPRKTQGKCYDTLAMCHFEHWHCALSEPDLGLLSKRKLN